jgi:hypothetical protein
MAMFADLRRKWLAGSLERQEKTGRSRLPARVAGVPRWLLGLAALILFLIFYWGILGWILEDTSTDLTLRPSVDALPPGGSVTVGSLAALTEAELGRAGWSPNNSWLRPTAFQTEMPALQRGIYPVLAGVATVLGSSGDEYLMDVADDFSVGPDRDWLHGDFPFIGGSTEGHMRDAAEALTRYNSRLSEGDAERLTGANNARQLVTMIGGRLANDIRKFDAALRSDAGIAAVDYQEVRGKAYAAAILLRGVQSDFEPVLRDRELTSVLVEAIETLDRVASEDPMFLTDADRTEQAYLVRSAVSSLSRIRAGLQ